MSELNEQIDPVEPTEQVEQIEESVDQVEQTDEPTEQVEEDPDFVEEEVTLPTDSKSVAKRIGKLSKKLADKDAELAALREQLKSQPQPAQPSAPVASDKPKLADFDTVEEFTEALTEWKWEQKQIQSQVQSQQQAKVQSYYQKVEQFQKSAPDFAVAVSEIEGQLSRDPNMVEFILESDFGPQIAYHLANNEEEIARISQLSPVRRIAALSKIESEMAQRKSKPSGNNSTKQPVTRVTTNTGSIAKSEVVNKDRSYAEWKVWREQNRKK